MTQATPNPQERPGLWARFLAWLDQRWVALMLIGQGMTVLLLIFLAASMVLGGSTAPTTMPAMPTTQAAAHRLPTTAPAPAAAMAASASADGSGDLEAKTQVGKTVAAPTEPSWSERW